MANCSRHLEHAGNLARQRFTVIQPVRDNAKRQGLHMQACRSFSVAIGQNTRKRRYFGNPAAIIFAFGFDLEHGLYLAVAALPINAAKLVSYRLALFFLPSSISRSIELPIAR
jgi:hypothetical protein